jgi:hypothetical protein
MTCFATAVVLAASLDAQSHPHEDHATSGTGHAFVELKGNVSATIRRDADAGEAPPSAVLRNVRLMLSRSPSQTSAFQKVLSAQLDKHSPMYHVWLTPEEIGRRFGRTDEELTSVARWLRSQGLTAESISPGKTSIAFSGSVENVERAFRTKIHRFRHARGEYVANVDNPKIPAELSPLVSGLAQLSTYAPRSYRAKAEPGAFLPRSGHFARTGIVPLRPQFTSGSGMLFLTPADAATMYDSPNAYNAASSSTKNITGTGVVIGVAGVAAIDSNTVTNYRVRFLNGDNSAPLITNIDESATFGPATNEGYLDLEVAGGMAPGATMHYYTADVSDGGVLTVLERVAQENVVDTLVLSFGLCEYEMTTSQNDAVRQLMEQLSAQGITVVVSTGDSGSAGCDDPDSESMASKGLQVNGFASTPYNIAVGGTDTAGLLSRFSAYVDVPGNPSGLYRSVRSYIPESTWNDSPDIDLLLSDNTTAGIVDDQTNIFAGGGGLSSCSTNKSVLNRDSSVLQGSCSGGYAKPTWQRGFGVPVDGSRAVPDVSLMAGNGVDLGTWLVCVDDTDQYSGFPSNCTDQRDGQFYFVGFGGTSTSAAAFAGVLAIVQESLGGPGHRMGTDAAKTLYDLYNSSYAPLVFHDITDGNNSVYCAMGSSNCAQNDAGYNFLSGYDAGVGYDLSTGLGSVDVTMLVDHWSQVTGLEQAAISIESLTQISVADDLTLEISVRGDAGVPAGQMSLSGAGEASATTRLDREGRTYFHIPAGTLAVGTHLLTLLYSGDPTYASTSETSEVGVATATPNLDISLESSVVAIGNPFSVTVFVSSSGPTPTGTITLSSGGYTSTPAILAAGKASIIVPAGSLPAGADILNVSYQGDGNYTAATSAATVSVTKSAPNVSIIPASSSVAVTSSLEVKVAVSGAGPTPTGTITLSSGGYTSTPATLAAGKASIIVPAGSLPAGADILNVSYQGDGNYTAATSAATVSVTKSEAAVVVITPKDVSAGSALRVTVTVSGTERVPTGSITLSSTAFTSAPVNLEAGTAWITIPGAGMSSIGPLTLAATYSGDADYSTGIGIATVIVKAPYSVTAVTPSPITAGEAARSTVTVKTDGTYIGTIRLSCKLMSSPNGAQRLPTCTVTAGSEVSVDTRRTFASAFVTIDTTARETANHAASQFPRWSSPGGKLLACFIILGLPMRRVRSRGLFRVLILTMTLVSVSGCAKVVGVERSVEDPGVSPGTYTFAVTGSGTPFFSPAPFADIALEIR